MVPGDPLDCTPARQQEEREMTHAHAKAQQLGHEINPDSWQPA
jgi:hypothetical protein